MDLHKKHELDWQVKRDVLQKAEQDIQGETGEKVQAICTQEGKI